MEEEKTNNEAGKWKLQDVGKFLKNSLIAIVKGEFLLRLNVGKYFIHIVYTFFLFAMLIWFSLGVDTTLTKVEKNKAELKELEIIHSSREFELRSINRRSTIDQMLQEMGSKVTEPELPAYILEK